MLKLTLRVRYTVAAIIAAGALLAVIWFAQSRRAIPNGADRARRETPALLQSSPGRAPNGADRAPRETVDRPIAVAGNGYVGSDKCQDCHREHYESWHHSYHRTMTQVASPESIVASFDNVGLQEGNLAIRLERRGNEFWVEISDVGQQGTVAKPAVVRHQIVQVTGSHHMQIYWFPSGMSRSLTQFPFAYLIEEAKWIPMAASFIAPEDRPHPAPGLWNKSCVNCHTTGPRPGLKWAPSTDPNVEKGPLIHADTHFAELGIACEACHGPGELHVRGQRDPQTLEEDADLELVVPVSLPPNLSSQVCGQCHSVMEFKTDDHYMNWASHGFDYRPGGDLDQSLRWVLTTSSKRPAVQQHLKKYPAESVIWSDGMIRVSGREYNGLIESPCFTHDNPEHKMSCFSCHTMHAEGVDMAEWKDWANDQLKPGMRTNQACTQCHEQYLDDGQLKSHTHHTSDSAGSTCYNCHMSYTTYGVLKAMRSHKIDSPTVQISLETGRPNACNQCHLDKTLSWTAGHLRQWYGIDAPEIPADEANIAASILWTLKGDAGQRALMAWSMGWHDARQASSSHWMIPFLVQLMHDPYRAIRIVAYRSLRKQKGFEDFQFDPVGPIRGRELALRQLAERYKGMVRNQQIVIPSEKLLMDSAGNVDVVNLQRLGRLRDNRPLFLKE